MLQDIRMDDVVRLRKQHPCGGYEWRVVRIAADIGLKCTTCEHRVLLSRRDFEKRLKKFVSRGPETPAALLAAMQSASAADQGGISSAVADSAQVQDGDAAHAAPVQHGSAPGSENRPAPHNSPRSKGQGVVRTMLHSNPRSEHDA